MIVQMSKKSKIYHRDGCRYINRITEEDLISFDIDKEKVKGSRACKCCCNMKYIYNNLNSKYKLKLERLGLKVETHKGFLFVNTPSYKWKVVFKPSTQELKLYSSAWDKEEQRYFWIQEHKCKKTSKLKLIIEFIIKEEKKAAYPIPYRKYVSQIAKYARENQVTVKYDGTDLYVLTDVAAWKIAYGYRHDCFKLLHCPFGEKALTMEEAKTAHYHVQMDVPRNQSPYKHIQYIVEHDKAKQIEQINYRNLPNQTKKQKRYYCQAKNRAKRKSFNRVLDLFAKIEEKEGMLEASFC